MDKSNVIYAGCGASTSGEQGSEIYLTNSGDWGGIMVSQDAGDTWSMTGFHHARCEPVPIQHGQSRRRNARALSAAQHHILSVCALGGHVRSERARTLAIEMGKPQNRYRHIFFGGEQLARFPKVKPARVFFC